MMDQETEIWWPVTGWMAKRNYYMIHPSRSAIALQLSNYIFNIYHKMALYKKKIKKKLLGHQMININKNII